MSKIVYWSWLGSAILTVTMENAISTQSVTLVYGLQNVVMNQFLGTGYWFVAFTYGTYGFNYASFFFYLLVPILVSFGFIFSLFEILRHRKSRQIYD